MYSNRYDQQFNSKALIKLLLFILYVSDCYWTTSGWNEKIIGGRRAVLGELPATVCLAGIIRCGGTLVSLDTVITAGHCFMPKGKPVNPSGIVIIGGTVDLNENSGNMQISFLRDYIIHDQFQYRKLIFGQYRVNDIALAFLDTAFIETKTLKPANFPANNPAGMRKFMEYVQRSNATCLGTGYGIISMSPKVASQYLKFTELILLPDTVYLALPDLIGYEICAISQKDSGQMAFGDSGSTFLCGGEIVGLSKGGLTSLVDGKNMTIMVFTLIGPYLVDFGLAGSDGTQNFQFLPTFLLCLLFTSSYYL